METTKSSDVVAAGVVGNGRAGDSAFGGGVFTVECFGADGELKWSVETPNTVVSEGLKFMNDTVFAGSAYTAVWYFGLVTGPASGTSYSAGDTLASHAGWTEFTNYTGNRQAATFGTATTASPSVITTSSPVSFAIVDPGGTVAGAFLTNVASGTAGILFSVADFGAPGDRVVSNGDAIAVSYTFSQAAA